MSETLVNNPTNLVLPPGSGLETTLSQHHNGVMTYSHYVNGSIFSVPKIGAKSTNSSQLVVENAKVHGDNLVESVYGLVKSFLGASGTNQGAIDNRIEQAMDLVKSHLMNAVRSEVEELKEKIIKLEETISQQQIELTKQHTDFNREVGKLQAENEFLKNHATSDVLVQLSNLHQPQTQPPPSQQPLPPQQPQPSQQQQHQ